MQLNTIMTDEYSASAVRHLRNSQQLSEIEENDNAGHLVGFAAECAIKHRITELRPGEGAPHGHLPALLAAARWHLGRRSQYTGMFEILRADIFADWNVNHRYRATGATTKIEVLRWQAIAKRLLAAANIRG